MTWGDEALRVMARVRFELIDSGVDDKQKIASAIDDAYPFGERARYPYKAWLAARRYFFGQYGLPMKTSKKRQRDMLDAE